MIRIMIGNQYTNSYYPENWKMTLDPFPAFRAQGQNVRGHNLRGFLPLSKDLEIVTTPIKNHHSLSGYFSSQKTKLIKTQKGGNLIVPANQNTDERIMLVSAFGSFRGGFDSINVEGGELIWEDHSCAHCNPVMFSIIKFNSDESYAWVEHGSQRGEISGSVDIFAWNGCYMSDLPKDEFTHMKEEGILVQSVAQHSTLSEDIAKAQDETKRYFASLACKDEIQDKIQNANLTYLDIDFRYNEVCAHIKGGWANDNILGYYSDDLYEKLVKKELEIAEREKYIKEYETIRDKYYSSFEEIFHNSAPETEKIKSLCFSGFSYSENGLSPQYVSLGCPYPHDSMKFPFYESAHFQENLSYEYRYDLTDEGLKDFAKDIVEIEKRTVNIQNAAKLKEQEKRAIQEHEEQNLKRINAALEDIDLPEEIKNMFRFANSEATDKQIKETAQCIIDSQYTLKTDDDFHCLYYCGIDRRVNAIKNILYNTNPDGFCSEALKWDSQGQTKILAQYVGEEKSLNSIQQSKLNDFGDGTGPKAGQKLTLQ